MECAPFKRRRTSANSKENQLALLRGLLQGEVPLRLVVSGGGAELAAQASDSSSLAIKVPQHLSSRCQLLQDAPDGDLSDAAETFAYWLATTWGVEVEGRVTDKPRQPSADNVLEVVDMLKACAFLRDEAGLDTYSRALHACLVEAPVMATLPLMERLHGTTARCSQPYSLLLELPTTLARRVLDVEPLAVLDRLPIGFALAALTCEVYNEQMRERYTCQVSLDGFLPKLWSGSERWHWRSVVAEHARARLFVGTTYSDWRERIDGTLHGLQVFAIAVREGEAASLDLKLPNDLEVLEINGNKRYHGHGWRALSLPASLQYLKLDFQNMAPLEGPADRLPLSELHLPAGLQRLEVNVGVVCPTIAALPSALTGLVMYRIPNHNPAVDLKALPLPQSLRYLHLVNCDGEAGRALEDLALPPSLSDLVLCSASVHLEALRAVANPGTLTRIALSVPDASPAALTSLQLPETLLALGIHRKGLTTAVVDLKRMPGLTRLIYVGLSVPNDDGTAQQPLALPPTLRQLEMSEATFGASGWLARQPLPSSLTVICMHQVDFGTETLERVSWPSALRVLTVQHSTSDVVLHPQTLPAGLQNLSIVQAAVSLKDVTLPASLTTLDLSQARFLQSDALADVEWATHLQQCVFDRSSFGSAGDLSNVRWPRDVDILSMKGCSLGRRRGELVALPRELKELVLGDTEFGEGGLQCLELPPKLRSLSLASAKLGSCGVSLFRTL